jgi:hypothetical protein
MIGVVAGSSAHLYDYLFSTTTRQTFSNYPKSWDSDKYQKMSLSPLRTKEGIRTFLEAIQVSACAIDPKRFKQITGNDATSLNRNELFNALSEDASLKVILEETAGVPGGILSFLSGSIAPCTKLPS